ncbi:adenylate kinase 8 isoform X1 [Nasonia vitripennis]|uniref:Uncharacterized protein n=2 Tax=Nasonia vitripennis TaxID=7425 RepID=A0A7M7GB85_NASVI|nr:adenylate kinase 8 isoform X1 [Nasonia vitripennis]XP_031778920.1 adenylate kinase 8 isoform X1 [Nasonia vitripennis]
MAEQAKNSKNRLMISQKLLSYLEKHRIFELFQELSMMLLIKKPEDHLLFLKQSIYHAARRLDAPRIIILAPPEFDKLKLAKNLVEKLQVPLVTLNDVAEGAEPILLSEPTFLVEKLRTILTNHMQQNRDGWVFSDFPRTEKEARFLQRAGITPSHVMDITLSTTDNPSKSNVYQQEIRGLRHVFSELLTAIKTKGKKVEDVTEECLNLVRLRKFSRAPAIFRILLMDSTDSERSYCLSQHLSQIFNITHIDFNQVLERISLQETKIGERLREAKTKIECNSDLPSQLKIQVFEEFLIQTESLKKGWVLTGLPTCVDDFKHLDMMNTPPNRLIIVVSQKSKSCNDNAHNADDSSSETACCKFRFECVRISKENLCEMIEYAGESASLIESDENLKVVKERVAFNLMQPPPCVPPRQPRPPPAIKPEDIEFDPDDEPSTEIFDEIREPEPILPLV